MKNDEAIAVIGDEAGVISEVSTFALRTETQRKAPLAPAETIVAVDTVLLAAGEIPCGIFKRFYMDVLGLTPVVSTDAEQFRYKHGRREVLLSRSHKTHGTVKLTIRNLAEVLVRLKDGHVHYDLQRTYDGLVSTIVLRDPVGNVVQLQQTRAF